MKYLLIVLLLFLQGCSTLYRMHTTIEYEPNLYYIEVKDPAHIATDMNQINQLILELVSPYCKQPVILESKLLGNRLYMAKTPVLRCNVNACINQNVAGAYVRCDKKPAFDYTVFNHLKKLDMSIPRERAKFRHYAKGNWKERDSTLIQTFEDFGYPTIAYINGYEKGYWVYNSEKGKFIIEFTGHPLPTGYTFTQQHIHLIQANNINELLHPSQKAYYIPDKMK